MRRILLACACVIALCGTAQAQVFSGVEVHDTSNIIEWVQSLASDAKAYALQLKQEFNEEFADEIQALQWAKQQQQYLVEAQQLATMAQQLIAFVHDPSLGAAVGLLNAAGLGSSLPINPWAVMQITNGIAYGNGGLPEIQGILSGVTNLSTQSYTATHVYTPTDGTMDSQRLIATGNSIAGTQGLAGAAYTDLTTHAAAMPALRDDLKAADNPKDVQDAQAEIELESTWTANQQAKLTAMQLTYAAQQDSRTQQSREQVKEAWDDQISQARAEGIIQ
jgi:hypothetical protein